ncbi:MAG: hypothetical protein HOP14_02250 [Acidobacteria bacterium]|nr:hypothetical protein [Acidobacteriota bacterium]
MYRCDDVLAEISDLLDEETSPDVRRQIETHLACCGSCQALVDSTRMTVRFVSECGELEVPIAEPDALVRRVMERLRRGGA